MPLRMDLGHVTTIPVFAISDYDSCESSRMDAVIDDRRRGCESCAYVRTKVAAAAESIAKPRQDSCHSLSVCAGIRRRGWLRRLAVPGRISYHRQVLHPKP